MLELIRIDSHFLRGSVHQAHRLQRLLGCNPEIISQDFCPKHSAQRVNGALRATEPSKS